MTSKSLLETVSELKVNIQKYIETNVSYYGLTAFEKGAKIINYVISSGVVIMIFALSLMFLSAAAALYIGKLLHSYELGLLIVGGFYFLLGIVLYLFREKIFGRCIIRSLLKILFHKEDE